MAGRRPARDPAHPSRIVDPAGRAPARPAPRSAEPAPRVVAPARAVVPAPGVREVRGSMFIDTASGTFVDRRPPPFTISKRTFEAEIEKLVRGFARNQENPGSVSSETCRRCVSCMFCVDCEECYRCTHCERCRASSNLTHCTDCVALHDCAYCVRCENCTKSNYLVLCRSCSECTYCFGCVGLARVDFHILNVKYNRSEYFRIVKGLEQELGLARE